MSETTTAVPTLKGAREAQGKTQADLSHASGVSIDTIRRIEQGRRERVSHQTWWKLCRALGIDGIAGIQIREH